MRNRTPPPIPSLGIIPIPHQWQQLRDGFTLIELLVVMSIIGILAAIGIPRFQLYVLQGHLDEAKPYLMAIAAREKARFNERGSYLQTTDETDIKRDLGVDLKGIGDFCFLVVCHAIQINGANNTQCQSCPGGTCTLDNTDSALDYIVQATGQNQQEFEVWAVLRNTGDPTTWGNQTCKVQRDLTNDTTVEKQVALGWVKSADNATNAGVGGQGRVVVLRYPPPP
ncbi:conserved hypothetical protein [Gammaproteobacteria bacterium]